MSLSSNIVIIINKKNSHKTSAKRGTKRKKNTLNSTQFRSPLCGCEQTDTDVLLLHRPLYCVMA